MNFGGCGGAPKNLREAEMLSNVQHVPDRALRDLTDIKKYFSGKHGEKKWQCEKCSKNYRVRSDWKAHSKTCGTKEYRFDIGTPFSRLVTYEDAMNYQPEFTDTKCQNHIESNQIQDQLNRSVSMENQSLPVSDSASVQLEKTACPLPGSGSAQPEKTTTASPKEEHAISEARLVDTAPIKEEHVIPVDKLVETAKLSEVVKEVVSEKVEEEPVKVVGALIETADKPKGSVTMTPQ